MVSSDTVICLYKQHRNIVGRVDCEFAMASSASSLKEYLKKYSSEGADAKLRSKSKKKKKPPNSTSAGVRIVDEDAPWQAEIKDESSQDDSPDEKPQMIEDIEVKRMKRMEALKMHRPYLTAADDGSGWVTVSEGKKPCLYSNDLSPSSQSHSDLSRYRRVRHDSPDENLTPSGQDQSNPCQRGSLPAEKYDNELSDQYRLGINKIDKFSPHPDRHDSHRCPDREYQSGFPNPLQPRKVRHDSPDLSPPRKVRSESPYSSPKRNPQRNISPRKKDRNNSPVCHGSHYLSPARVSQNEDRDSSPPRRIRHSAHGSASDPSTRESFIPSPRKAQCDSPDLSPPRKCQKDISPHRKDQKNSSFGHNSYYLSSARISHDDDYGSSSPRRVRHDSSHKADESPTRKTVERGVNDKSKTKVEITEKAKFGLRAGKDLKEDIDRKKKEESQRFLKMDPSVSGRGAETVYRDKLGKRLDGMDEFMKLQQGETKPKDKPLEWGKGLTQKREAEARQVEIELEKSKPFARSRDDPELEKMLKERIRWGDPMAHLVKKTYVEPVLEDLTENEKIRESGFIVPQEIPSHSWLKRGIDPSPNRYGIKPGRHWDGVDRSNGFERDSFKRQNDKRATEMEAYLWSVSEM